MALQLVPVPARPKAKSTSKRQVNSTTNPRYMENWGPPLAVRLRRGQDAILRPTRRVKSAKLRPYTLQREQAPG